LSSQGIIAPFIEPAAQAEFFALTNEHTRADLVRAVYEGMAFSIRDGYDPIPAAIQEIRLSSGAAKSAFFCQMVADVTGKRVVVPSGSEFGAKGAAMLAAVGIGWYETIADALAFNPAVAKTYERTLESQPLYDAIFATYSDLRDTLRPVWRRHLQREVHS